MIMEEEPSCSTGLDVFFFPRAKYSISRIIFPHFGRIKCVIKRLINELIGGQKYSERRIFV